MRRRNSIEDKDNYLILNGLKWDLENTYLPVGTVSGIREGNGYSYFTFDAAQDAAALKGKRCPTQQEFAALRGLGYSIDYNKGGFWFGVDRDLKEKSTQSLFFPFRGGYNTTGNLEGTTYSGVYWSSSPMNGTYAYNLNMGYDSSIYLHTSNTSTKAEGFSLRCVRDL